jgi:hypothetical protein
MKRRSIIIPCLVLVVLVMASAASTAKAAVMISNAGIGCSAQNCLWIQGSGFTTGTSVIVRDTNWNALGTYRVGGGSRPLAINLTSSPQLLTLLLYSAHERNLLKSSGLIITVVAANATSWANRRIYPPPPNPVAEALNLKLAQKGDAVDYLVQNVCVNGANQPIYGDPATCANHRNLKIGESVPYLVTDMDLGNGNYRDQANFSLPVAGLDGQLKVITVKVGASSTSSGAFSAGYRFPLSRF